MSFVWPPVLWVLALLPGLALFYLRLLGRKRPATGFARCAVTVGWRRHIPPILLLLALSVLIVAVARPAVTTTLAGPRSTIILAMDVSQSMAADDVAPTRMSASQQAAKQFIARQPPNVEVGIVAFAESAFVAEAPTTDHAKLDRAIDRLELIRSTAVGAGIITALQSIFPDTDIYRALNGGASPTELPSAKGLTRAGVQSTETPPAEAGPAAAPAQFHPVPPGSYESAIIILMTDGATTVGPNPRRAGQLAADLGVRVFTVAFGSAGGSVVYKDGRKVNAAVDEPTLLDIADKTGGNFFRATSAGELADVYATMSTRFVGEKMTSEIAFIFAGIGALIAMVAAGLSVWWFGRVA